MSDRRTVLIIGGYGTFGGRLVALLENEPRLTLIIAGRSLRRAGAFRDARGDVPANLVVATFDRGADINQQLVSLQPDIVVDASGPFQSYGHQIIEACIAHGINYLDLADDPNFVAGAGAFDAAARAAGVFVLSGVSSFPVLSAAAVRHLAAAMLRIDTIRGGIAPSPYAGVGGNVIRAIAGYAGQPIRVRRAGVEATAWPFTEQMSFTIAPPGYLPLQTQMFSLVDVPDLRVLAELWPDLTAIWMGAAPVPEILHRGLVALAWLVRLRLLPGLSPLAPLMLFATNHLRWGEHRGGMFVQVEGADATGAACRRSWHMIAEGNDGPYIPSMAAEAVVRMTLSGRTPATGARAASRELELDDYRQLFSGRQIVSGVRDEPAADTPLYAGVLGSAWRNLPAEIRAIHNLSGHNPSGHSVSGHAAASGRASVERGHSLLARILAAIIGFPATAADVPVHVAFAAANGGEIWTRTFGSKSFASSQFAGRGRQEHLLCEQFGPLTFAMALVLADGRLSLVLRHWRVFGVPLPMWLAPREIAYEMVENGKFRFHVEISHPFTGLIVRYCGWLMPDGRDPVAETGGGALTSPPD